MVYLSGQYPGGGNPDTIWQYGQAIGFYPYNDWHPVLHTLLFFTLPISAGASFGDLVALQLLWFSLAYGYLIYVLDKYGCSKMLLWIMCAFIWLNPFLASYLMCPYKDIAFMIFATILTGYYVQILFSKGAWLKKKQNILLFSLVSVAGMIMRHNAILFILPLVLLTLLYAARQPKVVLAVVLICTCLFGGVEVVYHALDVESPDKRLVEISGLPITIWCNVMKRNPDDLPMETREVFESLASSQTYQHDYVPGSFNSIKWAGFDQEAMDRFSLVDVAKYTVQCIWHAPRASLEAFAKLTNLVWGFEGKDVAQEQTIHPNGFGIQKTPNGYTKTFVAQAIDFFSLGLGSIVFGSYGLELLVLIGVGLLLLSRGRFSIVHILPLLCYNFGTMILLSAREYRFFLLNIPLWLPLLFVMLKDRKRWFSVRTK